MRVELYKDERKAELLLKQVEVTQKKLQDYFKGFKFEGVSITNLNNLSVTELEKALESIVNKDIEQLQAFGEDVLTSALNSRRKKAKTVVDEYAKLVSSCVSGLSGFFYLEDGKVKVDESIKDQIYYSTSIVLECDNATEVAKSVLRLAEAYKELKSFGYCDRDIRDLVDGLRQEDGKVGEITALRAKGALTYRFL